jgi:HAD superfamily hydrolase (TIGR01549 family)
MKSLRDARWLFFDVGNTLVNEEAATEHRIRQLVATLERCGRRLFDSDIRTSYREAAEELAPRLMTRIIEKLTDDLEYRRLLEADARYPKELETPYEDAEPTLRALSCRYKIGVIANQSPGTAEPLTRWGLMPYVSVCASSAEVGLEKPDPPIFQLALRLAQCTPAEAVMIGDRLDKDIRPARMLGWNAIRVLQGFARFQTPRDSWDEPNLSVTNLRMLVPNLMGGYR